MYKPSSDTYVAPNATNPAELPTVSQTGTDPLPLVKKDPANNTDINGTDNSTIYGSTNVYDIQTGTKDADAKIVGYAMFVPSPSGGKEKLELTLEMGNNTTQTVEAELEYKRGESYVITLKFQATEIKANATISQWKVGTPPPTIEI